MTMSFVARVFMMLVLAFSVAGFRRSPHVRKNVVASKVDAQDVQRVAVPVAEIAGMDRGDGEHLRVALVEENATTEEEQTSPTSGKRNKPTQRAARGERRNGRRPRRKQREGRARGRGHSRGHGRGHGRKHKPRRTMKLFGIGAGAKGEGKGEEGKGADAKGKGAGASGQPPDAQGQASGQPALNADLAAQSAVGGGTAGKITMWTKESNNDAIQSSSCLHGPFNYKPTLPLGRTCAVSEDLFQKGKACGKCYKLSYEGGNSALWPGKPPEARAGSAVIQVINNGAGETNHFDCVDTVFKTITGIATDGFHIKHQETGCS